MTLVHAAVLSLALSAAALPAAAGEPIRYLELSNRAHDSLVSLAIGAPGSEAFHEIELAAPLRGGGDAATYPIAADACRFDLRFTFRNGRSMIYRDVDVCAHRVSIRPLPRAQAGERDMRVAEAARTSP